jgi:hypothetical protein
VQPSSLLHHTFWPHPCKPSLKDFTLAFACRPIPSQVPAAWRQCPARWTRLMPTTPLLCERLPHPAPSASFWTVCAPWYIPSCCLSRIWYTGARLHYTPPHTHTPHTHTHTPPHTPCRCSGQCAGQRCLPDAGRIQRHLRGNLIGGWVGGGAGCVGGGAAAPGSYAWGFAAERGRGTQAQRHARPAAACCTTLSADLRPPSLLPRLTHPLIRRPLIPQALTSVRCARRGLHGH